jgi:triosephosphate isomerase
MTERTPLFAGNWKMHLTHLEAIALVQKLAFTFTDADYGSAEIVVLPAFTSIRSVQTAVEGDRLRLRFGAQDLSPYDQGAYTGDVSGPMLARLGCSYVVVGHSERRQHHGETDELVAAKAAAAYRAGITPILCVGESLDVRRDGGQVAHCRAQLAAAIAGLAADQVGRLVLAYEPIWAIGTGEVARPEDAQEVCGALRAVLAERDAATSATVRILYGGSVKPDSIAGIMAQPDVDGALVGGASLSADEFAEIIRFADRN